MQCIIKKGMSVIQQIKLIVSLGLHFGKPFHGDDRLLLQIDDDGVAVILEGIKLVPVEVIF